MKFSRISLFCSILQLAPVSVIADVEFAWATIGHENNLPDPLNNSVIPNIGAVQEVYRISVHEVTNAQYAEFLNSVAKSDDNGLYSSFMGTSPRGGINRSGISGNFQYTVKSNMSNKPVNYVSFLDAMRFANWLHNGQPVGPQAQTSTEAGAYLINDGLGETRSANARYFVPTENEWYKAAYYEPAALGGDVDSYWLYPTRSNSVPVIAVAGPNGDISNSGPWVANYGAGADWNGQDGNVTTVGSAGANSSTFFGTFDQGGNVWEWNDSLESPEHRVVRGGVWDGEEIHMRSTIQAGDVPSREAENIGFRIASPAPIQIPAVTGWSLLLMGLCVSLAATHVLRRRGCCAANVATATERNLIASSDR